MTSQWSVEIAKEISAAIEERDQNRLRSLLTKHPQNRLADGNDFWMESVAGSCWLDGVKTLVDCGIGVNASSNRGIGTEFHEPEGAAILSAVESECSDVVAWLLDNGARINFEVDGAMRCLPLLTATRTGNREIAKMLVDHGADIHAVWGDGNATTIAEQCGQYDIRDYLVALGGVDLRDSVPPDLAAAHRMIDEFMVNASGAEGCETLHEIGETDPPVTIQVMASCKRWSTSVLYTQGLSDRPIPDGRRLYACTELFVAIPHVKARQSVEFEWASTELARVARELNALGSWPSGRFVDIERRMGTPFTKWYLMPLEYCATPPDYRIIQFHELVPVTDEESEALARRDVNDRLRSAIEEVRPIMLEFDRPQLESLLRP